MRIASSVVVPRSTELGLMHGRSSGAGAHRPFGAACCNIALKKHQVGSRWLGVCVEVDLLAWFDRKWRLWDARRHSTGPGHVDQAQMLTIGHVYLRRRHEERLTSLVLASDDEIAPN